MARGILGVWAVTNPGSVLYYTFQGRLAYLDEYCVGICAELVQLHRLAGRCRVGHERVSPNRAVTRSLVGEGLNEQRCGDYG